MNKKWGGDEILLIFQKGIKRENETEDSLCFHFEKEEGREKRNEEANLLMEALAGALEKQIRAVPERFDKDVRWKKMKGVLDFKRRTLLYVLKDQLVIEYHKEHDLVKRPLKVVR